MNMAADKCNIHSQCHRTSDCTYIIYFMQNVNIKLSFLYKNCSKHKIQVSIWSVTLILNVYINKIQEK